jgi:hypothetical protein
LREQLHQVFLDLSDVPPWRVALDALNMACDNASAFQSHPEDDIAVFRATGNSSSSPSFLDFAAMFSKIMRQAP